MPFPDPIEREDALVARVHEAFPGWRVRTLPGGPEAARRHDLLRPPEILVGLEAIRPDVAGEGQRGGAAHWSVWIVARNLRSREALRTGAPASEDEGLSALALRVREALAGFVATAGGSPMVPLEGRLHAPGGPAAVWEERFRESLRPPSAHQPILARNLEELAELTGPLSAGTDEFVLPGEADLPAVGERLLAESASPHGFHDLGVVTDVIGQTVVTQHGLQHAADGLALHRAVEPFEVPLAESGGAAQHSVPNAAVRHDLTGGSSVALLGAAATMREVRFSPMREEDAAALCEAIRPLERRARFLFKDSAGRWWSASSAQPATMKSEGWRVASVAFAVRVQALESLAEFVEEGNDE